MTQETGDLYTNSKKNWKPNKFEDWGYFFYPERLGNAYKPSWYEKLFSTTGTTDTVNKVTCEKNLQKAYQTHPGVQLLLKAMKSVGCEVDLMRHFSCERCDGYVKGGFDASTNQVIVCYNTVNKYNDDVAQSMINSLLESYDYCRANYNSQDLSHLACTKVRAANLTSCSYFETFKNSFFKIDNSRKECVRQKAALSLQTVRNVSEEEALKAVDSVFDKCYNDLEPFGRRVFNKDDCERAYKDRKQFGFE